MHLRVELHSNDLQEPLIHFHVGLRWDVKDFAPPSNDLHISWVLFDLGANIHALLLAVWETHIADQAHVTVGCED